jgi:hypothetical protein
MLLTYKMLRAKGACGEQADKFRALFPAGVVLTEALCVAHASNFGFGFGFGWAATNLLSDTAREAYKQACAPAREAYKQACATAREAYKQACAIAFFAGWQADYAP